MVGMKICIKTTNFIVWIYEAAENAICPHLEPALPCFPTEL